ncbi:amidohydrolase family protein [Sphingomonas bacterium]|uniref:amidohydrolase family protein n=1 Tax=Sphingomonas bacterium TaxID=1895847 RepID=UPI001C2D3A1B|nr:amidohydrolase family protein [Sphingomonas bacterium]
MRLIATEEGFAPVEYIDEYLKLSEHLDTGVSRYLAMYYRQASVVRQFTDLDSRLPEMDEYGVDVHLLGIAAPGVQAFDAALGTDLAQIANETLVKAIARHPTRFAGLAAVAPQDPAAAAREVTRGIRELGMNGVIINSHTHGEYLDDPKFWPILEAAVACDAPIYIHPTFPSEAMSKPYADYGMMGALWGFGADASVHVVRMIMGGVFDAFPDLKIVLGHLGEGLAFWLDRLDNRYGNIVRRGGLEPLGMKRLERRPSEYFRSNFYMTTSGMNTDPPLKFCLDMFGPERIMFAIDYPYEQTSDAVPFIKAASLDDAARRKIMYENAEALFRISPAAV